MGRLRRRARDVRRGLPRAVLVAKPLPLHLPAYAGGGAARGEGDNGGCEYLECMIAKERALALYSTVPSSKMRLPRMCSTSCVAGDFFLTPSLG